MTANESGHNANATVPDSNPTSTIWRLPPDRSTASAGRKSDNRVSYSTKVILLAFSLPVLVIVTILVFMMFSPDEDDIYLAIVIIPVVVLVICIFFGLSNRAEFFLFIRENNILYLVDFTNPYASRPDDPSIKLFRGMHQSVKKVQAAKWVHPLSQDSSIYLQQIMEVYSISEKQKNYRVRLGVCRVRDAGGEYRISRKKTRTIHIPKRFENIDSLVAELKRLA